MGAPSTRRPSPAGAVAEAVAAAVAATATAVAVATMTRTRTRGKPRGAVGGTGALRERSPRQIDTLLEDLGCDLELGRRTSFAEMVEAAMPPHRPSGRALWVGALINPLPG